MKQNTKRGEGRAQDIGQWLSFKRFGAHNAQRINRQPSDIGASGIDFSKTHHSVHSNNSDSTTPAATHHQEAKQNIHDHWFCHLWGILSWAASHLISGWWEGRMWIHFCGHNTNHRLSVTHTACSLDFISFLQVFHAKILNGPSNDRTTPVGLLRFEDGVEVNVRIDLEDHSSMKDQIQISEVLWFSPNEQYFCYSVRLTPINRI